MHSIWIYLIVIVAVASIGAVTDWLCKLVEPMLEAGIEIPRFPAFLVLVAIATVLAWPQIEDYVHVGDGAYRVARMQHKEARYIQAGNGDMQCLENTEREYDQNITKVEAEPSDSVLQSQLWTPPAPDAPTPGCRSQITDDN